MSSYISRIAKGQALGHNSQSRTAKSPKQESSAKAKRSQVTVSSRVGQLLPVNAPTHQANKKSRHSVQPGLFFSSPMDMATPIPETKMQTDRHMMSSPS